MRDNKGITLIALVITIIVMLILVTVSIQIAVDGGLFDKAGSAASQTKTEVEREQAMANGVYDGKDIQTIVDDAIEGRDLEEAVQEQKM